MTWNKCLHPRSSVVRSFIRRKGGRGLISVEDCITTERRGLYDYLKESKEDMLSGVLKENVIEEGETKDEFTKRKRDERKKTLHKGQFVDKTRNVAHKFSGKCIRNGILKKEMEGMLFAAQEHALRTDAIKAKIDKHQFLPNVDCVGQRKRQLCIKLVVALTWHRNSTKEDMTMLPEEYIGNFAKAVESSDRWYEHTPAEVVENDEVKLFLDLTIQTEMTVFTQQARYYPSLEGNTEMDNH